MKKKGLIITLAVVAVIGGVVAVMALTGGGVTAADETKGKQADQELSGENGVLANPDQIEMPTVDPKADSIADQVELEEFDPNDI